MRSANAIQFVLILTAIFFFFFHGLADSEVSGALTEKTELEALYSVIQGFVGKWWNGSELYPDPCGWTPIQGVSCDLVNGLWYVTILNIGPVLENSLECDADAEFTQSIFKLKYLKTLTFFDCFNSDQPVKIPSTDWEKLAGSLETLEFRSNRALSGEIPAILGQLTNLESLVLVENAITGELPQELGNLTHLRKLALAGNSLSGQIPHSLGNNLKQLLILDLSRNSLTGPLPMTLGNLTSLLKLDLSSNLLNDKLPSDLGKLRNLTLLDLRSNNFSGGLTEALQGMVSLQDMLLSNNPLGGGLMEFENLKNLTNLDLSNTGLIGEIPESITGLSRLRFIALDNNHLTGSLSPKLAALPGLSALYLNGNNLSGELRFPEEFYERLGRRFASWNNPDICYSGGLAGSAHAPLGVGNCKDQGDASNHDSDSENKKGRRGSEEGSNFISSFGFATTSISGFWGAVLVQELVVVYLLLLLLY